MKRFEHVSQLIADRLNFVYVCIRNFASGQFVAFLLFKLVGFDFFITVIIIIMKSNLKLKTVFQFWKRVFVYCQAKR